MSSNLDKPSKALHSPSVTVVVPTDDGCRLELDDGSGFELPHVIDARAARAFGGTCRRLDGVRVVIEKGRALATVAGIGSRTVPFVRRVPVALAISLIAMGVPGEVRGHQTW